MVKSGASSDTIYLLLSHIITSISTLDSCPLQNAEEIAACSLRSSELPLGAGYSTLSFPEPSCSRVLIPSPAAYQSIPNFLDSKGPDSEVLMEKSSLVIKDFHVVLLSILGPVLSDMDRTYTPSRALCSLDLLHVVLFQTSVR